MSRLSLALAMVLVLPGFAFAQGGNRTVPAGDSLEQTPPADVTRQELRAAPPTDVTPGKVRELKREPGVNPATVPSRP